MIGLGKHDSDVGADARAAYLQRVKDLTRVAVDDVVEGVDKLGFSEHSPDARQSMSVSQVQRALKDIGFFPGGDVDGICGYRTLSAIRLFQEYVRSVEGLDSVPDGLFGPNAESHLERWMEQSKTPDWADSIADWRAGTFGDTEYGRWLALGGAVQAKYAARPNRMLEKVSEFAGASDTKKVGEWDFDPRFMHIIGVRREESSGKFDDIFIFLIKGLVFKFQGSTEPGSSKHERGRPFLAQGQHDFHCGWHQKKYLALRPQHMSQHGVLVFRAGANERLDPEDVEAGAEANGSINIHWAGKGLTRNVGNWSEGCQVITGSVYVDYRNEFVDCSSFAALNNGAVGSKVAGIRQTRGAYNVLLDLGTALSSDLEDLTVKYLLLVEEDLALSPELTQSLSDARARTRRFMGK